MSLYERALKRMEALAAAYAQGDTPWGPDRDLVTRETAADAVMDVFATLDALRQGVELPPNRIEHTLAMLMLIREYVVPLPSPSGERICSCKTISNSSRRTFGELGVISDSRAKCAPVARQ
jgi:hypothetical protein